ncbi:hypothetical protein ILUMI_03186 [Ignelater luminosus]|uniref:U3 small nucleolar ribonucleoprotein protein MPP10 n=1 Tax=Ignelater luminosus TaxID=2038154 RepID=A0A8K0DGB2_IGNLU|nr:hypothetical protein ILUMI_03186 [Ignelater luminosus]
MDNKTISLTNIIDTFQKVSNKPETFISSQESFANDLRCLLKNTYDFTKTEEFKSIRSSALPELIIENFDLEQIWQQVELQNDEVLNKSVTNVSRLAVAKNRLLFEDVNKDEDTNESDNVNNEDDDESDNVNNEDEEELEMDESDEDENNVSDNEEEPEDKSNKKLKSSIVDDEFFKLNEMNNFLLSEEKKLNKPTKKMDTDSESEESVDMFEAGSEHEEDDDFEGNDKLNNPRYKDFFGTKTQQRMEREKRQMMLNGNEHSDDEDDKHQVDDDDNNDETDNENEEDQENVEDDDENKQKSSLELREERLKMKIKEIEEAAVNEKPWQLKGEVTAESRPENSLLQEVLEFDLTTRPAPVITEETTHLLEDVIKQRIKDKAFDDVVRKEKPVENVLEFKKKLLLDQEKSKESLAQIYEKEYVQQRDALNPEVADKEEEEPSLHQEIKTMMHSLFTKLDALSNFHFTPKPAAPELKIVSNLPAISMEEVAPVASSDATLLAPEEIKRKNKGDIIGKSERTGTDKKRERRKKKQKQREHAKEKEKREKAIQKVNPGLGNKYSKEKARKMLERVSKDKNVDKMDESLGAKSVKSSTAFFTQLQDEVKQQIRSKTNVKNNKNSKAMNAKKIKL